MAFQKHLELLADDSLPYHSRCVTRAVLLGEAEKASLTRSDLQAITAELALSSQDHINWWSSFRESDSAFMRDLANSRFSSAGPKTSTSLQSGSGEVAVDVDIVDRPGLYSEEVAPERMVREDPGSSFERRKRKYAPDIGADPAPSSCGPDAADAFTTLASSSTINTTNVSSTSSQTVPNGSDPAEYPALLETCRSMSSLLRSSSSREALPPAVCAKLHSTLVRVVLLTWPSAVSAPRGRPRLAACLITAQGLLQLSDEQLSSFVSYLVDRAGDADAAATAVDSESVPSFCVPALLCASCFAHRLRVAKSTTSRVLLKALQKLCHHTSHATIPFLFARLARPSMTVPWLGSEARPLSSTSLSSALAAPVPAASRELLQRAARQAIPVGELSSLLSLLCTDEVIQTSAALILRKEGGAPGFATATCTYLLAVEAVVESSPQAATTSIAREGIFEYWAAAEAAATPGELSTVVEPAFTWGVEMVRVVGGIVGHVPSGGLDGDTLRQLLWRLDISLPAAGTADPTKVSGAVVLVVHALATRFGPQLKPLAASAKSLLGRCQSPLAKKTLVLIDKHAAR